MVFGLFWLGLSSLGYAAEGLDPVSPRPALLRPRQPPWLLATPRTPHPLARLEQGKDGLSLDAGLGQEDGTNVKRPFARAALASAAAVVAVAAW